MGGPLAEGKLNPDGETTNDKNLLIMNAQKSGTLKQSVIAKLSDISVKTDVKDIRSDAKKYMLNVVRKQDISHPELGHIRISGKGIKEFLSNTANTDKLALVPHLKELIETSTVGERQELTHKRKDGIVAFYPLYNTAEVDGNQYNTTIKIGVDKDGNLFYTLLLNKTPDFGGAGTVSVTFSLE